MKKLFLLLVLLVLIADGGSLFAQKIFLSPEGNDSNQGTNEQPLRSLHAARDKARELRKSKTLNQPLEIIVGEGEYFMNQPLILEVEDSGTPSSPLVFRSAEKKAVFTAGVKISGFEKVNDKLWRKFIPEVAYQNWYFEQLYVNDRRATRARTPDEGFYFVKNVVETVVEKGASRLPELAAQSSGPQRKDNLCSHTSRS